MLREKWSICRHTYAASFITGYTLGSVSLLTLSAISVDRLQALLLGLRYRQVVTLKRTYATIIVFLGCLYRYYCVILLEQRYIVSVYLYSYISLLNNFNLLLHKDFLTLRHRHRQVQNSVQVQPNQTIPLNIARYRKTVSSVLWVQLTLVVCYVPHIIAIYLARQGAVTLIYLNSSLNPILYCWKIREIRQAVKETITQMFCSWS